ncbi:TonB-dependent receptor [uncultured Maribacter sp.]|uniref:TonB-dependent receptor n=1 Tax=uncultured Maribacter sp. TaxID=431308 RepID=UPI0026302FD5|nr:TonB-dependent receptor [uncultured Maribacter sp.]
MKTIFTTLAVFTLVMSVSAQKQQTDSLEGKKVILDEVFVSAVRVTKESPVTFSNLTKEDLKPRNLGQDIPILMNFLPSVVTTSDAGAGIGYTGIRVRGSDATRVNVTINGIPYNDAESQGTFWVNMPDFASSIESLQLQRGVGTSTNGSGAFGASLNILTDAVSEDAYGQISSSIGSFNTFKNGVKFSTGLLNNHIEISGRLSKISSDGYVDRASSDLKSYFLQAAYVDDNTRIKALSFGGHEVTYQSWYGVDAETLKTDRTSNFYTYENEVDNFKQDHFQFHWNQKYNAKWSSNLGLNYTKGRGYFEQYKEEEDFEDYDFDPIIVASDTIKTTDLIRRRWLTPDFYVINGNANFKDEKINLILGGSYSLYDSNHFGEIIWAQNAGGSSIRDHYYDGTGKKTDLSFFSKATYNISPKFIAYADLQVRFVNYKTAGIASNRVPLVINESYAFFNPKAGFTYKINKNNSLYSSFAVAQREPNRDDFKGDVFPKSERLNDFEFGWRFLSENTSLNVNGYYMGYKNQLVLTGDIDDVGEYKRANVDSSYRAGLEIDANFRVSNALMIRPNLAISTNKIKDFVLDRDGEIKNIGDTNISFSPTLVAGNVIQYQPIENFSISLLSKYVGEQYLSNTDTETSKLDAYFVNDINITYEIKPKAIVKSIVLSGLINNVLNEKYESNGYTYLDYWSTPGNSKEILGYYPQAGTNFLLGATINF